MDEISGQQLLYLDSLENVLLKTFPSNQEPPSNSWVILPYPSWIGESIMLLASQTFTTSMFLCFRVKVGFTLTHASPLWCTHHHSTMKNQRICSILSRHCDISIFQWRTACPDNPGPSSKPIALDFAFF